MSVRSARNPSTDKPAGGVAPKNRSGTTDRTSPASFMRPMRRLRARRGWRIRNVRRCRCGRRQPLGLRLRTDRAVGDERVVRSPRAFELARDGEHTRNRGAAPILLVEMAQDRVPHRRRHGTPASFACLQQRRDGFELGQHRNVRELGRPRKAQHDGYRQCLEQRSRFHERAALGGERVEASGDPLLKLALQFAQRLRALRELAADGAAQLEQEVGFRAQQRMHAVLRQHPDADGRERDHARRARLIGEERELAEHLGWDDEADARTRRRGVRPCPRA